jgi:hypothetical protein
MLYSNSASIYLRTQRGQPGDCWRLLRGGGAPRHRGMAETGAPTGVRLVLSARTGNNIQCVRERGGRAQCANKNKGAWEMLQLKQLVGGRGHYVLTSLHNGCNLQCRPDGAVSFANKNELQFEQWTIERQGEQWFFVSVHTGKVLQCGAGGQLRCANHNRKGWEAFRLVVVDGGAGAAAASAAAASSSARAGGFPTGRFFIVCPSNGKVLDISGGVGGHEIIVHLKHGSPNQQWVYVQLSYLVLSA